MDTDRYQTLFDCVSLFIAGESRKIRIRLCSTVARSGDIVLPGVSCVKVVSMSRGKTTT